MRALLTIIRVSQVYIIIVCGLYSMKIDVPNISNTLFSVEPVIPTMWHE